MSKINPGFSIEEIQQLKDLCKTSGKSFVNIEDEDLPVGNDTEMTHIQFVGQFKGKEVIYDAMLYTLQIHYASVIYEEAEREVCKQYPLYVPLDLRDETYQANERLDEEVEMMILEVIDELEETDEVKVSEFLTIDEDFDFGIGIEAAIYVPALDEEVISNFVSLFNEGKFIPDSTLYSFKSED
ncbi:MAG: hypothetical protein RJA76_790 [Bacteroidota bacterium]|jgi:hypothetical protein